MSFEPPERSPFLDRFEVTKLLGKGGFGSVYLGTEIATGNQFAIKEIAREGTTHEAAQTEWKLQGRFECPYIVNIYDFAAEPRRFLLVMEFVNGGELFDALVDHGPFSERAAAVVVQHCLVGLKVLHDNHVVHRDIKPENLLLQFTDDMTAFTCKLTDFGLAGLFSHARMQAYCGTTGWAAPEIMRNVPYDASVDMWSLGCIMYALLTATRPFDTDDEYELYDMIIHGEVDYGTPEMEPVSALAKDLMNQMLQADPLQRISVDDALNHQWIRGNAPDIKLDNLHQHLKIYNVKRKLKRVTELAKAAARFAKLGK
jgi:serine/threonine protein kinase